MPRDGEMAIDAVVAQIVELGKMRRFCIKAQSSCDRRIDALIAGQLGYSNEMKDTDRQKLFRQAAAIRKSVEKGRGGHISGDTQAGNAPSAEPMNGGEGQQIADTQARRALSTIHPLILLSAESRDPFDARRKEVEKHMASLADFLPVAGFVKGVAGLSNLSLAMIVAEAGLALGDYRTVSGLWKRLGLAVIDGERQRKRTDKVAAAAHGYSPRRRAEIYVVGSVSLFMAQKPGMPYRDVYDHRRAQTAPRVEATADLPSSNPAKWTKGRCDNDARRVMTKALIRDLWVEWRKATNA